MKWKNRLTNYNFWISIVSAVLLVLQNLNVQFDIANFNELTTAVLGLLVVIGIINDPTKSATKTNAANNKEEPLQEDTTERELSSEVKDETIESTQNTTDVSEDIKEPTSAELIMPEGIKDEKSEDLITAVTPIDEEDEINCNTASSTDEISVMENIVNQIQALEISIENSASKIEKFEQSFEECKQFNAGVEDVVTPHFDETEAAEVEEINSEAEQLVEIENVAQADIEQEKDDAAIVNADKETLVTAEVETIVENSSIMQNVSEEKSTTVEEVVCAEDAAPAAVEISSVNAEDAQNGVETTSTKGDYTTITSFNIVN